MAVHARFRAFLTANRLPGETAFTDLITYSLNRNAHSWPKLFLGVNKEVLRGLNPLFPALSLSKPVYSLTENILKN